MGFCPTTPSGASNTSLDPQCHGQRMWTTFLFSSLFTLFGGWLIIVIYDTIKAMVSPARRSKVLLTIKRYANIREVNKDFLCFSDFFLKLFSIVFKKFSPRRGSLPWSQVNRVQDSSSDDYFSWLQAIKEWENNLISGQTKMGKTLVRFPFNFIDENMETFLF